MQEQLITSDVFVKLGPKQSNRRSSKSVDLSKNHVYYMCDGKNESGNHLQNPVGVTHALILQLIKHFTLGSAVAV